MTTEEHIEQAKRFLVQAEREFEAGDQMQASEKMWGAASHAVMAAAQSRDMPWGSHRAQRVAVEEISAEQDDPHIKTAYALAGKFHSNFYHGFMEEEDWAHESPIVRDFTEHMLGLVENGQLPQGA
jgi:hypothetical protein